MPEWQELTLRSPEPHAIAEVLEACGALAVTMKDAQDNPVLEPAPGQTPLWPQTLVVGLFAGDEDRAEIEERLHRGGGEWILSAHWDDLPEQVWERTWLAHFRPMDFGTHLRVAPHGAAVADDQRVTLRLDPGLAFGTGTHPSTALCLRWLGDAAVRGTSVMDYGCGSGILGIAAALLGAESVTACDIDPQAEQATRENAQSNQVDITMVACADAPQQTYDLVLANILAGTLIDLADVLVNLLNDNGTLVMAGLLDAQIDSVKGAFPDLEFTRKTQDEWAMLVGRRKNRD